MRVNGLLAAPSFALWLEGEPLDIAKMLYTPEGKPRVAIVSVAHLSDSERMFFLTLLLNRVVSWMRAQSGTSSLRAMLYLDEVAGYMPPVANPPSKQALLLLMKQARAFGLGVVLATQNPIDIDYKGLSNAGTWFLGRLQTERDKARLLDGLEGALQGQGHTFDRGETERILSSLQKRTFFLHDVHEDAPVIFQTRWAMSYLRGPLTKDQIRLLTPQAAPAAAPAACGAELVRELVLVRRARRPRLPPMRRRRCRASARLRRPIRRERGRGAVGAAGPAAAGRAVLRAGPGGSDDPGLRADAVRQGVGAVRRSRSAASTSRATSSSWCSSGRGAVLVDWESAEDADLDAADLETAPAGPATFEPLPPAAAKPASYGTWQQGVRPLAAAGAGAVDLLRRGDRAVLAARRDRGGVPRPREPQGSRGARRREGAAAAEVRAEGRRRSPSASAAPSRPRQVQEQQASEAKMQTGISVLGTIAGALFGRKAMSMGTLGKATTAARGMGRTMRESGDVGRANETLETYKAQLQELEHDIEAEIAGLEAGAAPPSRAFTAIEIRPKKTHVVPERVVLIWRP